MTSLRLKDGSVGVPRPSSADIKEIVRQRLTSLTSARLALQEYGFWSGLRASE